MKLTQFAAAICITWVLVTSSHVCFAQAGWLRICDSSGCAMRPPGYVSPGSEAALLPAQEDQDTYQGEPRQQLEAQNRSGSVAAAYKLGMMAEFGLGGVPRDPATAVTLYSSAAARGHIWSQYRLGSLLTTGARGVPPNPGRATELFFAAAKLGHPQSANNVGLAYLKGKGLPQNGMEAVRWLTVAADAGILEAQHNLGIISLRGEGIDPNLYDGFRWTKRAAERGKTDSQKTLGRIYMTGLSTIRPNLDEATRWLEPLAYSGDKEAQRWIAEIRVTQARMAEEARVREERAAETFKFLAGVALAAMLAPSPSDY